MKRTIKISKFTTTILTLAIIFILYGYFCRVIEFNFFWESKSIGWSLLLIAGISYLADRIKIKKLQNNKTLFEKIGIGVTILYLCVQIILLVIFPFTDAYAAATAHLAHNSVLKSEVGNITEFRVIPTGNIQKKINAHGESGSATINLIVKGNKKFKDITIYVVKRVENPGWTVRKIK